MTSYGFDRKKADESNGVDGSNHSHSLYTYEVINRTNVTIGAFKFN